MSSVEECLYLETDSSCANCGFRDNRALTIHHIDKAKSKNRAYDNLILLCHNCHHCLNENKGLSDEDIKVLKRRLIIKTLTQLGLNAMKEAYRKGCVVATPFLVNHLIELQYLKYADKISSFSDDETNTIVDINAIYTLTEEGKRLLEKWNLK